MLENFFNNQILVFLIVIFSAWLSFWVYFTKPSSKINQTFSLYTFFYTLWIGSGFFSNFVLPNYNLALFFTKLRFGSVVLCAVFTYLFVLFFPRKKEDHPLLTKIIVLWAIIVFFTLIFTDFIIKNIKIEEWGTDIIFGEAYLLFFGGIIFLAFLISYILIKKYFLVAKKEKLQLQYFLIGIIVFIIANLLFNVFAPIISGTYKYYQIGDYSAVFLLVFTSYAVMKRELFGIRVVVTTIFVALIAILLAVDTLFFTTQFILQIFKGGVLILFLYFGYLLIRSVINEIERREEVERLSRAKSEFISIASHQLRTPLTAIKGYISMILEGTYGKIPEKTKEPMKKVYESNSRLISLVNNLLSISRIESGKLKLELEKASLEDIISNVIDIFQIEAKEKGIYLKFEKPKKPLPKIMLDEEKMTEVISNVVNNDIKYTEKGGITIKVKKLKSKIMIIVKDTGVGMTEDELDKMFKSFSRGMAGNRLYTKGAGLGLYISRKFVEMHNGKIWAESEGKNKGSTFYIELPMK
jgi:signal transduction histidine kinase